MHNIFNLPVLAIFILHSCNYGMEQINSVESYVTGREANINTSQHESPQNNSARPNKDMINGKFEAETTQNPLSNKMQYFRHDAESTTCESKKANADFHELKLAKLRDKLNEMRHIFLKRGKNILKLYDLVNMVMDENATSVGDRAALNICSNFGWDDADSGWKRRFSTYNYHLCRMDQGGGGDCFFHSLAGSLRNSGYTKGKIKSFNTDNPHFARFAPINLTDSHYFTHVELRKMAAAFFITYNPERIDDIEHFDEETFLNRMQFYKVGDIKNLDTSEDKYKFKLSKKIGTVPIITIANKVYKLHAEVSGKHWGDAFDKAALEKILNISIILFRSGDSCLLLGDYDRFSSPKAFVLIYYFNMCHYQSCGLVKIGNPTKIQSTYSKDELPDTLSLIAFLDTGIEIKL